MFAITLNGAAEYATIVGGLVAGVCGLVAVLGFSFRMWTKLNAVLNQVTPNGGDTDNLGDRVQRIEEGLGLHVLQDNEIQSAILERLPPKPTPRRRNT